VIERLHSGPLKHGELKALAEWSGHDVRTLRIWRRGGGGGRPGRRPRPAAEREDARKKIAPRRSALTRGKRGWRSLRQALADDKLSLPTRLIQETLRELNTSARQEHEAAIEAARVSVHVVAKDGVWAVDQMELGREGHTSVRALAASDCSTRRILDVSVGPPATGKDVVALLERAAQERGGKYPFVVQMDNGSENQNALVRAWAVEHEVILLFNIPHTPQHNARAERTNGDLRLACALDKPTLKLVGGLSRVQAAAKELGVPTRTLVGVMLAQAWQGLDERTPRASLGHRTPCELDRIRPRAEDRACRARFYREVCEERQRIARLPCRPRDQRKLVREAIWCALERHGLVERTRGGLPVRAVKPEGIT
jgi:transposase InsO family protein